MEQNEKKDVIFEIASTEYKKAKEYKHSQQLNSQPKKENNKKE